MDMETHPLVTGKLSILTRLSREGWRRREERPVVTRTQDGGGWRAMGRKVMILKTKRGMLGSRGSRMGHFQKDLR